MPPKYKLLHDSTVKPEVMAGTIVYQCLRYDYGLASDDTAITGEPHISVTLDPQGGYPSFTAPVAALQPVEPNSTLRHSTGTP